MRRPANGVKEGVETSSKWPVLLYIPNLIGYVRVALLVIAIFLAYSNWIGFVICYTSSQILDAADGWAARKFGQETRFGAVLDQVTDRISTVVLYVLNCQIYPEYTTVFLLILMTDMGGHWLHTFGAALAGSVSHKRIPGKVSLLKLYYEKRVVMLICIIGYEGCWMSLFLLSQIEKKHFLHVIAHFLVYFSLPIAIFKIYTNIHQGVHGALVLAGLDDNRRR
ncbi:putative phosphatidylinositol synthase [Cardiosporidium cionae]|uniref:CDP-diacylglycerol--inositol 3-phosphatidyltransferase n=1 Tax=Cardiosporidium cionae TaxID=476202 RepID=A0ABQ7JDZ3_9APIC|nr:putative phosphatidylinositol synthase [Cardiosporidium cionae]|eukprot:KAF8822227.1 putative phosphatidylinositol synthase [Cardiosporidium cionae]